MSSDPYAAWNIHVAQLVQQLEGLLGRPAVSDDYARLRIGLVKAQHIALGDLEDSPIAPLTAGAATGRAPLVPGEVIGFDQAIALRLFSAVVGECRQHGRADADLGKLESAVWDRPRLLAGFVRHGACRVDDAYSATLARRLNVSADMLLFVGRLVAATFVTHMASRLRRGRVRFPASEGSCPVCGATPGLATLSADGGRRALHCSLCAQAWSFDRLKCPFCRDVSPSGLVRLSVEGEDARWVEACAECRHYLRVTDLRQPAAQRPVLPLAEEVAGLGLDLLVQREGYMPKPPYAALW